MRRTQSALLVVGVLLALQLAQHATSAQFSFSLPGKWGNGKRAAGLLPYGKHFDCEDADPEVLFQVYRAATAEMTRVGQCLQNKLRGKEHLEN